ncbi:GTP-binding protein REM 2-like isoform X9 [Macrobrachium rosenbergii]|uniref:GTP-binding protein REM 2-like isoform X9 n=1 Tax=Macrobrachium rosenbergii TaxID=79674 RepID=UPI0034D4EC45
MSRLASIRLTSTDSESTSLSGYQNSGTSQDYIDSDVIMSPLSPKSPKSPKSPFTPKSPVSPMSPRSPRGSSRPCSTSPLASPVRGGNLAYLASRRSSRDSEAGDVAPLNYARYKQRRRSNFLELPTPDHFRPRVCSLPEKPYNPRDTEELYRLRSFSITSKGVINRGDSLISKTSRSNTSVCSTASRHSIPTVSEFSSLQSSSEDSYVTPNNSRRSSYVSTAMTVDTLQTRLSPTIEGAVSPARSPSPRVPSPRHTLPKSGFTRSVSLRPLSSSSSLCRGNSNVSSTTPQGHSGNNRRQHSLGCEPVSCQQRLSPRLSASNLSVHTLTSRPSSRSGRSGERSPFEGSCCGSSYVSSESELEVAKYRVVLLGESGVGKSSLVTQFMTSEYINTYDASLDDEFGEKSVSVLLDGEESEVIFIDHPAIEMSVENCLTTYDPHACVVVYSITDKGSFKKAEDTLNYLWRENYTKDKAVIVVGNKVDLARSRIVTSDEGKSLASCHDSKFIETSSGIQHNVDELLVGIVKQVRLRLAAHRKRMKKMSASKTSLSLHAAKELLSKMCLLDSKSKSCENLHVL